MFRTETEIKKDKKLKMKFNMQEHVKKVIEKFFKLQNIMHNQFFDRIGSSLKIWLKEIEEKVNIIQLLLNDTNSMSSVLQDIYCICLELKIEVLNERNDFCHLLHAEKQLLMKLIEEFQSVVSASHLLSDQYEPTELEKQTSLIIRKQQKKISSMPELSETLTRINHLRKKRKAHISCFISYAYPSESRPYEGWTKKFIEQFSEHLRQAGIVVLIDTHDSCLGYNSNAHMDKICDSHFVILFGTQSLLDKHRQGVSSVCVELINTLRKRQKDAKFNQHRVVPVILSGEMSTALPAEYERYTVITSLHEANYINFLKGLIRHFNLYGHDHQEYNEIWQVIENKYAEFNLHTARPIPFVNNQSISSQTNDVSDQTHLTKMQRSVIKLLNKNIKHQINDSSTSHHSDFLHGALQLLMMAELFEHKTRGLHRSTIDLFQVSTLFYNKKISPMLTPTQFLAINLPLLSSQQPAESDHIDVKQLVDHLFYTAKCHLVKDKNPNKVHTREYWWSSAEQNTKYEEKIKHEIIVIIKKYIKYQKLIGNELDSNNFENIVTNALLDIFKNDYWENLGSRWWNINNCWTSGCINVDTEKINSLYIFKRINEASTAITASRDSFSEKGECYPNKLYSP